MVHKTHVICIILVLFSFLLIITSQTKTPKKITYFATEHPNVTYYDTKYIKYANLTSQRYGRRNPFYYVGLHFHALEPIDDKKMVHFYFFELLTNVYKRGFIEMHLRFCDLIMKDKFFGPGLRQYFKTCPMPPGEYHLYNMTIPTTQVPRGFPFTKGRIYSNVTLGSNMVIASGYIDFELKQFTQS